MNDLVISLGAVLALFLIELALGLRWSRWYCNTGLPIFWRRIERASGLADLDLDALQKSCATAAGAPIVFRRIGPELIAFREKPFGGSMHYFPIMRGVIRHRREESSVLIAGLVKWWVIAVVFARGHPRRPPVHRPRARRAVSDPERAFRTDRQRAGTASASAAGMKPVWIAALLVFAAGCATSPARVAASDAEIQRLESSKWNPSLLGGGREEFLSLFADDFVSVEYGSDVQGGVHRKTRADVFSGPPLPPAEFELSDWRFIHADPHVFIVSYRVKGISYPWQAYATSVWVNRGGRWQTVFYQASTAE